MKIAEQVLGVAEAREAREEVTLKKILGGQTITFDMFRENYGKLNLSEEPD